MTAKGGYVYIAANISRSVLYIGVTNNLYARIYDHKSGNGSFFTKKYNCRYLLYYAFFDSIEEAIQKEKQLKKWKRNWKDDLIKSINPKMVDLSNEIEDLQ